MTSSSCKAIAIILAGGVGSRMQGYDQPKQFLPLAEKPLIVHSLQAFDQHPDIQELLVTLPDGILSPYAHLLTEQAFTNPLTIIPGGATRQESSYNALEWIATHRPSTDIVAIHDAARPFVCERIISEGLSLAHQQGACEPSIPVTDTIVRNHQQKLDQALDRNTLVAVQTPQCFRYALIWEAHQQALTNKQLDSSDDALLVHRLGHTVHLYEGSVDNIKITYLKDYQYAQLYADATR